MAACQIGEGLYASTMHDTIIHRQVTLAWLSRCYAPGWQLSVCTVTVTHVHDEAHSRNFFTRCGMNQGVPR